MPDSLEAETVTHPRSTIQFCLRVGVSATPAATSTLCSAPSHRQHPPPALYKPSTVKWKDLRLFGKLHSQRRGGRKRWTLWSNREDWWYQTSATDGWLAPGWLERNRDLRLQPRQLQETLNPPPAPITPKVDGPPSLWRTRQPAPPSWPSHSSLARDPPSELRAVLIGTALNLRKTTSQKCAAVPRRARI